MRFASVKTGGVSFLRAWAADPGGVGAVAPSGPALAKLIAREITSRSAPVIELGPGTGVFTDALLARGVREEDLTLIESHTGFARLLEARFPEARVIEMDAVRLRRQTLRRCSGGGGGERSATAEHAAGKGVRHSDRSLSAPTNWGSFLPIHLRSALSRSWSMSGAPGIESDLRRTCSAERSTGRRVPDYQAQSTESYIHLSKPT